MEPELKMVVHENAQYIVHVARMPDMTFDTYAVVNKRTGVIEQLQPNLYNATLIADQFSKWLTEGPSEEEEVAATLAQYSGVGKFN